MLALLLICMQDWRLAGDDDPVWRLSDREEVVTQSVFVEAAESRRDAARFEKPLVELWTTTNCPPCDRMKADIQGGCLYGASIVWNRGSRPDTAKGFPQCRVGGESFVGWNEAVKERVREAAGLGSAIRNSRTVAAPTKQLNSNGFDVGKHLRDDHGVSTDGMTLQQMEALHNRLHGWQQGTVSRRPQVQGGILRRMFRR
jgi:thiol-disulfide isomerase/thioredoxin